MTSNPPREFRTDAIRPSAIQTGTLGRRNVSQLPNSGAANGEDDAADALEKEYQRWNTRIDTEMVALSSGLRELIQFANITPNPPPHTSQTTPLQLKVTTSQIIRSTQNLRDIAHDLKLALLLSNQVDTAEKRDEEMRLVRSDIARRRREVGEGVVRLLNGGETRSTGASEGDSRVGGGRAADLEAGAGGVDAEPGSESVEGGGEPEDDGSDDEDMVDVVEDVQARETQAGAEGRTEDGKASGPPPPEDSPTITSTTTGEEAPAPAPAPAAAQPFAEVPAEIDSDDEDMEEV